MVAMTRRTAGIVFVLLVALAGFGVWVYMGGKDDDAAQALQTVVVSRQSFSDTVLAQGKLEPKDYVDVGVQVSGQLKKLYVDIGHNVKKGDLLAELDPQIYRTRVQGDRARIATLTAQREQQKAQAAYDEMQLNRARTLLKSKAISQQEMEEKERAMNVALSTLDALAAQIEEAEASLETNQVNLDYTKIYAPMDGVVSDKIAREGQTLNASQTTPTIVQIANLDVMTIRAQIAEADVMRLRPGMETSFTTLGSMERRWKGVIRQILPTPEIISDVVLYNALIDVENSDHQLMNGMSTQNSFVVGRAEMALTVPTQALSPRADDAAGQGWQVRVVSPQGAIALRDVKIGLMTRLQTEILSGIKEGETVLLAGGGVTSGGQRGPRMPGMGRL